MRNGKVIGGLAGVLLLVGGAGSSSAGSGGFALVAGSGAGAGQTASSALAAALTDAADERLDASLEMGAFELNTLLANLTVTDIGLRTRIKELSAPLNQVLSADSVVLEGDWQLPGQRRLALDSVVLENAQITVAYFARGRSNLHVLAETLRDSAPGALMPVAARDELVWSVEQVVLRNVTVNVFDDGYPIASVLVPELEIPAFDSTRPADEQVNALLWPLLNQLGDQLLGGSSNNTVVDGPRFMKFLWREMSPR